MGLQGVRVLGMLRPSLILPIGLFGWPFNEWILALGRMAYHDVKLDNLNLTHQNCGIYFDYGPGREGWGPDGARWATYAWDRHAWVTFSLPPWALGRDGLDLWFVFGKEGNRDGTRGTHNTPFWSAVRWIIVLAGSSWKRGDLRSRGNGQTNSTWIQKGGTYSKKWEKKGNNEPQAHYVHRVVWIATYKLGRYNWTNGCGTIWILAKPNYNLEDGLKSRGSRHVKTRPRLTKDQPPSALPTRRSARGAAKSASTEGDEVEAPGLPPVGLEEY
ncbi:hypothetical protein L1987_16554 [Smallanthus sonchifolius]|uniref:Uncharacterized protein n=1 Tax=Smallanthus sonchifolius TaxID=185202 RepID=A0ACB9J8N5_9ASTR|nr:hypothetical protein L1987_16554 [Smallanthus sonchifolius]